MQRVPPLGNFRELAVYAYLYRLCLLCRRQLIRQPTVHKISRLKRQIHTCCCRSEGEKGAQGTHVSKYCNTLLPCRKKLSITFASRIVLQRQFNKTFTAVHRNMHLGCRKFPRFRVKGKISHFAIATSSRVRTYHGGSHCPAP